MVTRSDIGTTTSSRGTPAARRSPARSKTPSAVLPRTTWARAAERGHRRPGAARAGALAKARRRGRRGDLARPGSPSRCTLPITALRVTPKPVAPKSGSRSCRRAKAGAAAPPSHPSKTSLASFISERGVDLRAPNRSLLSGRIRAPRLTGRAAERHTPKRSHEGPPHDISWLVDRKLHYSLNLAQESGGAPAGPFPQLSASRAGPRRDRRARLIESHQDVSERSGRVGHRAGKFFCALRARFDRRRRIPL